ncbi:response regulator [Paenibacillus sp. LPE1-1-1.1]|uniref:response regulator n=1 Tax=Paenibacillus sp. LPE1-1-1.1 TaxID=3135230 RepID=UPI003430001C
MVVDDEKAIREGIKRTIDREFPEIDVSTAASAADALHILLHKQIHAVFLDILMPGMNGLELLKHVGPTYSNMIWIVVSAHSEFRFAQEAMRLGARDYILKPIGKDQIIAATTVLLSEWNEKKRQESDHALLELNLKYLREAVFRRWIKGLDIGHFDLTALKERHDRFYLLGIKLENDRELSLKNFVAENIMSEYIGMSGSGFIVTVDGDFLAGVVTLNNNMTPERFQSEAITHLDRCLKVPYQFYMSSLLTDFYSIPSEIRKLQSVSDHQVEDASFVSNNVIDTAVQYIHGNFHENLSLELVASVIYLNPVYFSKLFKQTIGIGFKEYVTQLRMERAAELLADPKLTVTKIGEMIGYPDVRHFTQVFRKKYNCSPGQYRAEIKLLPS